jgi:hypothetical protein
MSDHSPKVVSLAERLEARARETAAEFARHDVMAKMLKVSVEAIQKMRALGATSVDIARHYRFLARELDEDERPQDPPTAPPPVSGS